MGFGEGFSRAVAAVTTAISLAVGGVASSGQSHGQARQETRRIAGRADIDLYRGLGSWVDIYERSSWRDPQRAVAGMHRHGVRTLYIQTTNYVRKLAIKYPTRQMEFIEAAHRLGMKVVAWYLPGFRNIQKDFWRSMKAIDFRTPSGQGFDSFALDIESPEVQKPWVRTERLLQLSRRIRDAVGTGYPLGAITPTPLGLQESTFWPGFPYRGLARLYDVFVPMTYFTFDVHGERAAHDYTTACIRILRRQVGNAAVPIHVIGGISNDSNQAEARGFVHAVREQGVIGASYYAYHGTSRQQWWELQRIPTNPIGRPALPVSIGYQWALGDLPGGDRTHPRDVVFQAGAVSGSRTLTYRAFGVRGGQVTLRVNWHPVEVLPASPAGPAGIAMSIRLPGRWFHRGGDNFVSFTASGRVPWGVRTLRLSH